MDEDTEPTLSVDEFVEYCRTQVGLLSGRVETMGEEADELLDDIDERVSEIRARLEQQRTDVAATDRPSSTDGPDVNAVDVAEIEELQDGLEEKQALVEAKQTRMEAFQRLAGGYADLAEKLATDVDDGPEAFERVVQFEADNDAPAYFPERKTLVEAATESADEGAGDAPDDGTTDAPDGTVRDTVDGGTTDGEVGGVDDDGTTDDGATPESE